MPRTRPAVSVELDRRLCLRCGYRGRLLQGDRGLMTFTCPSCRCDLYARPPRSYAEMEGLHDQGEDSAIPDFWSADSSPAPIERAAIAEPRIEVRASRASRMERTVIVGIVCAVTLVVLARAAIGV